jgi:hypothetical protein
MGLILTNYGEAAHEHEGFVGRILHDGTVTSSWSAETDISVTDQLVAKCSCGWISDQRWTNDAPCPAEMPSVRLRTEILSVWEMQHAVPALDRVAADVRGRVARHLRDLAGMVEAGRPSRYLVQRFDLLGEEMRGLPDPSRAIREVTPEH